MDFESEVDRLIAGTFAHVGRAASFTPNGGAPVPCVVTLDRPDVLAGFEDARVIASDAVVKVAIAGLPKRPCQGDRFTIGGKAYPVVDQARVEDDDRRVYSCPVEEARA